MKKHNMPTQENKRKPWPRCAILICFLWMLSTTCLSAQMPITAFEVYDCLGRKADDPAVLQLCSRLGKWEKTIDTVGFHLICFVSGSMVSMDDSNNVESISFHADEYGATLPFGLSKKTRVQDARRLFSKADGKLSLYSSQEGVYVFILGQFGRQNRLGNLGFNIPSGYCYTRSIHFAGVDMEAVRQYAGEKEADFRKRIAPEEAKLLLSLRQNESMAKQAREALYSEHLVPLAELNYTLGEYNAQKGFFPLLIEGEDARSVYVPNERSEDFRANIALGKIRIACEADWHDSKLRYDEMKFIELKGKSYEMTGEIEVQKNINWMPREKTHKVD